MILENVTNLASRSHPGGMSNLDSAIAKARAAGFATHAFELTPLLFGTPQSVGVELWENFKSMQGHVTFCERVG